MAKWSEEEISILKAEYYDCDSGELVKILDRTIIQIYHKASSLGLKRNPEKQRKHKVNVIEGGKPFRFQPGHEPANKGQKMDEKTFEKCSKTMFKKGHKPHNHKDEGYERKTRDGYIEVKIGNKFRLKHRVVWEQHNGTIPNGQVIVFKDGNSLNTNIDNLMLVSREDLMMMNTIQRYPDELKKVIRALGRLKGIIEDYQ